MALRDLTPQLRTRLSRMERAVGWFVLIAVLALLFGFGYYLYNTAERKGWFKIKATYFTFTERATGLRVGDPVQLMGFDVGRITRIDAQPPYDPYNVYVEFEVQAPHYGYLWTEGSYAKVAAADFLGKRILEVTKGSNGYPTYVFYPLRRVSPRDARVLPDFGKWVYGEEVLNPSSNDLIARPLQALTNLAEIEALGMTNIVVLDTREERNLMTGVWNDKAGCYEPYQRGESKYWLLSNESPAVTDRIEQIANQVQEALPGILNLTNQLGAVLSNTASLTANLNEVAVAARPAVSNLAAATAQLDKPGALGEWLIPTNINTKLDSTLGNASDALTTANTNLAALAAELTKSLENLASITSNLNTQVEANTNILSAVSKTVVDADHFVQGLKRHWLLRSAFREKGKAQPQTSSPAETLTSPKQDAR
jgi:ABC-type transporter Mla subunit MlaD